MSRTSVALKKHQSPQLVPSVGCPPFSSALALILFHPLPPLAECICSNVK